MSKFTFPKKTYCFLGLLVFASFFIGSLWGKQTVDYPYKSRNAIEISVILGSQTDYKEFLPEDLSNHANAIVYHGLSEVNVSLNGETMKLEQAIKDGLVTIEEIISQARIDAKNSHCAESYVSTNGLTTFTYRYKDFEIFYTADIFEAPDGEPYLIQDFRIAQPGIYRNYAPSLSYADQDGDYINLARENWGINFEVTASSPSELKISISQSGGQQFGRVFITDIFLCSVQDGSTKIFKTPEILKEGSTFEIQQEKNSELNIDFSKDDFSLPEGNYLLEICVDDIFDHAELHDFCRDYTTRQFYSVNFQVSK